MFTLKKTIQMACGQAYVVSINNSNDELLEIGDVFLPNENEKGTRPYRYEDFGLVSDKNKRVITICTSVGCCYGCKFCASKRSFKRLLNEAELVDQVDFCLKEGLQYDRLKSPVDSKEFHVLYTRMGEPMLNIENVIGSINTLIGKYSHIKIGLSTCGLRNVYSLLEHPEIADHLMMQFSAHGTDEKTRSRIFDVETGDNLMTLEEIAGWIKEFRKLNPRKVSLNFVLLEGIDYDFSELKKYFDLEDIYLRLSPLNVTNNSKDNKFRGLLREQDVLHKTPLSSDDLKKIIDNAKQSGFAYAYAPAIDEEIKNKAACGQALETLREGELLTFAE